MSTPDGRVVQILGVTRDISERKGFEAELRRLAITDSLPACGTGDTARTCSPPN